jgi:hypothetical protein
MKYRKTTCPKGHKLNEEGHCPWREGAKAAKESQARMKTVKQIGDAQTGCVECKLFPNDCGQTISPDCSKNPWQPQPDSEGWWWYFGEIRHDGIWELSCFNLDIAEKVTGKYLDRFNGKWQKAIVPEVPKEKP